MLRSFTVLAALLDRVEIIGIENWASADFLQVGRRMFRRARAMRLRPSLVVPVQARLFLVGATA